MALALHKTVAEVERTMTPRELRDWCIYEATVSALPDRLADTHNALLCSTVVNLVRSADAMMSVPADFYCIRDPAPATADDDGVQSSSSDDGLTEAERLRAIYYGGR